MNLSLGIEEHLPLPSYAAESRKLVEVVASLSSVMTGRIDGSAPAKVTTGLKSMQSLS